MKLTIGIKIAFFVFLTISSCITSQKKGGLKTFKNKDIELNGFIYKKLNDVQISKITSFQKILYEVKPTPLDQTIEYFQIDLDPNRLIAIWERIGKVYQDINNNNQNLSIEDKNDVFNLLLYRSRISKEQVLEKIRLKSISLDKAAEFLNYYGE